MIAPLLAISLASSTFGYMEIDPSDFPRVAVYGPAAEPGETVTVVEDGRAADARVRERKGPELHLVIVVDSSDSMTDGTLADLRQTLPPVLRDLEGDTRYALIDADSSARLVCPFTPAVEELSVALEQPTAGGGDAPEDGLCLALSVASAAPAPRAILFITDGRAPDGLAAGEEATALAVEVGVPVFAIGLGVRVDTKSLLDLAEGTGGAAWFMSRQADVSGPARQMAHTLLGRSCIRYVSPSPEPDGRLRHVTWAGAHGRSLVYRAPVDAARTGLVLVSVEGIDGPRGPVPVAVSPEGGGETRFLPAGRPPAALSVGRYRFEAAAIGRPSVVADVVPGQTTEVRLQLNGRLLVKARAQAVRGPDPVAVSGVEGDRAHGYGVVGYPIDLPAGQYAVEVGVGSSAERRVVDVAPGRMTTLSLSEAAAFELQLADADGQPLSCVVYLKAPDTWETVATGRSGGPIEAPPGRYLVDYDLPHGGGWMEVTLEAGRTTQQWIGPAARLTIECTGAEGFVSPPLFLKPKGGTRSFAMGRTTTMDLVFGAYELTLASLPPVQQAIMVIEGQKATQTFDCFGALLVTGPENERYRLTRAEDEQWVGVLHFGERVHLVAGTYHVLPRRARQGDTPTEVTVVPGETAEVSIETEEPQ